MARRELARRGLVDFGHYVYRGFVAKPFHARIAGALEAVERGEITRLIISVPPRHGKSTLTSEIFPAWFLGRNPDRRIIACSYAASLAHRFSRKARNLIAGHTFSAVFGERGRPSRLSLRTDRTHNGRPYAVALADDSRNVGEWDLAPPYKGGYTSAGVGGSITGKGAHCFPAGTLISTERGLMPIEHLYRLYDRHGGYKVWAFDHDTGRPVLRRIEATRKIEAHELVEIVTTSGRCVRATGNHPVYVQGRGYRQAALLNPGDRLVTLADQQDMRAMWSDEGWARAALPGMLSDGADSRRVADVCRVRGSVRATTTRPRQGATARMRGRLLFRRLFTRPSRGQARADVRPVRDAHAGQTQQSLLFTDLSGGGETGKNVACQTVPVLRDTLHSDQFAAAVLRPDVRGRGPRRPYAGIGQRALQGWDKLRDMVRGYASSHPGARPASLCNVRRAGNGDADHLAGAAGHADHHDHPPYQRGRDGQHPRKSCHALQDVPRGTPQVEGDAVAVVRRLRPGRVAVYDLQVDGCHNFFADGVLAHNCLLIDDPVKGAKEAASATIQESIWEWYLSDAYTRLEEDGAIVIIMTRWSEDDLAGRVLRMAAADPDADQWVELRLPALAEEDDPLGRPEGAALWEEKFPVARLAQIAKAITARPFAALFQQRPVPAGGDLFETGHLRIVDAAPADATRVRYWDKAGTQGAGAYTAGVRMARGDDGVFYVEHVERGQWASHTRNQVMENTTGRDGPTVTVWVEQEPGSGGKESAEITVKLLAGSVVRVERVTGDKITRALPYSAQVNAGNVCLVKGPWNRAYIEELTMAPNGKYWDQIDASSGAFNKLASGPGRPSMLFEDDF